MASSASGFWRRATGASGKGPARAALAAALAAAATPSWGFWNDRLELWASETITHDSNVFRLPGDLDPRTAVGADSFSDRLNVHGVGLDADIPWSRQRFRASYAHFWTRYQRFDQLDFDGHVASASWLWTIGSKFHGDLGYTSTEGLASFATFRGTTPDVITTRQAFASGNWRHTARWSTYGGVTATERTHGNPAQRINDLESASTELRLTYETPQENRIALAARVERGRAPEERLFQGVAFDNGYRQAGIGVVGRWQLTGNSRLDGRIDYVRREYDQFSERDYSGPAMGVTHTWTPTGKLTLVSTVRRDIAPLDDVQTTFVLVDAIGVRPRWDVTDKIAVVGSLDYARWKYSADPLLGADYEHRIRAASLGFIYQPFRAVAIQGSAAREVRTSDLGDADYKVNIYTLEARVGF